MKLLKLSAGVLVLGYGFLNAHVHVSFLEPVFGGRISLRQLFIQSNAEVVLTLTAALIVAGSWLIASSLRSIELRVEQVSKTTTKGA